MCPEWTAGIFSSLTFSWLNPLIRKGYKTPLQDKDIWSLPPTDRWVREGWCGVHGAGLGRHVARRWGGVGGSCYLQLAGCTVQRQGSTGNAGVIKWVLPYGRALQSGPQHDMVADHNPTTITCVPTVWLLRLLLCRVGAIDVRFRAAWEHQLQSKGPKKASLFAACASAVGPLFLSALPFKLLNDASQFVGPVILNRLLTVVAGQASQAANAGDEWAQWLQWLEAPLSNGYCLAFLLFFGTTFGVLADNQHFQRVMRAGFRLKAIVTAEVYRKVRGGLGTCDASTVHDLHGRSVF